MALKNVNFAFSKDVNNPTIINTNREVNSLLALINDENVNLELSGYLYKETLFKSQYTALSHFSGLSGERQVQYDRLINDEYSITTAKELIAEGESTKLIVSGSVVASSLVASISHSITISYAPSGMTDIQIRNAVTSRVKFENGVLSCAPSQENASWTDTVTIEVYPLGFENDQSQHRTCMVTIAAKAITSIAVGGLDNLTAGQTALANVLVFPEDHTKAYNRNNVRWSVKEGNGTIDGNGMYVAPSKMGTYSVDAELTVYPSSGFEDILSASTQITIHGVLFDNEHNVVVFEAMKQAYPSLADRTAISTFDVQDIDDIAPLFTILKAEPRNFSFDEFEYFTSVKVLPTSTSFDDDGCMAESNITSITFPPNLISIGGNDVSSNGAFGNWVFTSYPSKVDYCFGSFSHCLKLASVNFGTGVKNISGGSIKTGDQSAYGYHKCYLGAFAGCTALQTIVWGNVESVTNGYVDNDKDVNCSFVEILIGAFCGCTSLVLPNTGNVKTLGSDTISIFANDISYSTPFKSAVFYGVNLDNTKFPNVTALGRDAFKDDIFSTTIDLSNSKVTQIDFGSRLFHYSTISTLILPNTTMAFVGNCNSNATWVWNNKGTKPTNATIISSPNTVITSLSSYLLTRSGSASYWSTNSGIYLPYLHIPNKSIVCSYGSCALAGNSASSAPQSTKCPIVIVPDNMVDRYKAASGWSFYQSLVTSIGNDGIIGETEGRAMGLID